MGEAGGYRVIVLLGKVGRGIEKLIPSPLRSSEANSARKISPGGMPAGLRRVR